MKLVELLAYHDENNVRFSLKKCMGDGYLVRHNPIYREVRIRALEAKFKFTGKPFAGYDTLPLTQLPTIIKRKQIPYVDNVAPIRDIEKRAKNKFTLQEIPPLKANYIFHESAHAVAHSILRKLPEKTDRERAMKTFLEESFANACESVANLFSGNEIHDEFLHLNTYIMEEEKLRAHFRKALGHHPFDSIFKLVMLSFLHANFLKTNKQFAAPAIHWVFADEPKEAASLRAIFTAGLSLDPEFTQFTNDFCLKLMGIRTPMSQLFSFDLLKTIQKSTPFTTALETLSHIFDEAISS